MALDDTSVAIGALQADVSGLKSRAEAMDGKLDQLIARKPPRLRLSLKEWATIAALGAGGGGGIAHALRKFFG